MSFTLVINITLIVLLLITITYSIILNARLKKVRNARQELQTLVHDFVQSSETTKTTVNNLLNSSAQVQQDLGKKVKEAEELYNDLKFIVSKGEEVVTMLDEQIHQQKQVLTDDTQHKHVDTPPQTENNTASGSTKGNPQEAILRAIREMR